WIGGTLAFLIMFLFLRDLKSPLLIGISVPVSLLISLLFFFLLKISVNIISLSGLILGMGMMIDNSIIVIDNIVQHRDRGLSVSDSCVRGTQEVIRPLISSVLTTCAVFIPLIFIPGISGALFYDQAMAISIGLFTSLVVSVTLIPVYFRLFHKNEKQSALSGFFKKIQFYAGLENSYGKGFDWAFRYRKAVLFFCAALLLAGGAAFHEVSKEKFPSLNTHEAVVNIDWNRSVSVAESRRRLEEFFRRQDTAFLAGYSCMAGPQDFLLEKENKMAPSEARVFFRGQTAEGLNKTLRALSDFRREKYPEAVFTVREPETVFEKVFGKEKADVEIRLSSKNRKLPEPETVARIEAAVKKKTGLSSLEKLREQQYFEIIPDFERLSLYSIPVGQLISTTRQAFNRDQIFTLKQGQNRVPVVLSGKRNDLAKVLLAAKIGRNRIPLASLVKLEKHRDYREYAADKNKPYVGRRYRASAEEAEELASAYREALKEFPQIDLDVQGGLLENKTLYSQLAVICLISVL
ncbi:MAG: efflux RND transporter permease subunit, partial [Cytophagales bacterium]|nr:efflux RND transporter permease subunit [Cytophagales bacterium]